jgi:hypothetical protein
MKQSWHNSFALTSISLNGYLNGLLVPSGFVALLGVAGIRTQSHPKMWSYTATT